MNTLTMVTVYAAKRTSTGFDGISAYGFVTSDYQTIMMSVNQVLQGIGNKKFTITNLGIDDKGKLVATNGALNRYSMINTTTGMPDGEPMAVVLNRVEKNGKLVGYTMFMQDCTIREVGIKEAVAMCNGKVISNGKLRHTNDGDIVSSINGNFILRQIEPDKAPKGTLTVTLMYFEAQATGVKYFGGIISSTSAVQMTNIRDSLEEDNRALMKECEKAGKVRARVLSDYGIQRMSENSFFGSFTLSALDKLINVPGVQFKCNNEILISISDAKSEKSPSIIKISKDFKITNTKKSGDESEYKKVFDFAQEIIKKYGNVIKIG